MLHRLVQLLETVIDLITVISCDFLVDRDQFVKMADAAVLFIACFVDTMALWTLKLTFGALFGQMLLQVLAGNLYQVACVTWDELIGTFVQMVLKITRAERWAVTFIWARENSLLAFFCDMAFVFSHMDEVICALVDTFKCGSVEHLCHHWMELLKLREASLALSALLSAICLDAVAADNFMTAWAVASIYCDIITVAACGTRKHGVRA
jgi:hypothetical protein